MTENFIKRQKTMVIQKFDRRMDRLTNTASINLSRGVCPSVHRFHRQMIIFSAVIRLWRLDEYFRERDQVWLGSFLRPFRRSLHSSALRLLSSLDALRRNHQRQSSQKCLKCFCQGNGIYISSQPPKSKQKHAKVLFYCKTVIMGLDDNRYEI